MSTCPSKAGPVECGSIAHLLTTGLAWFFALGAVVIALVWLYLWLTRRRR